ncbi:MAG TPA: MotA/TolQ/ExbB proton channel family protein [Candidatus Krumholzibacterium sp.]|nr:MotA/TolQ/ExbB proton channel family protein [Candidatus Krumholzibacterium sp.]
MPYFFRSMGMFLYPMLILTVVIAGLSVKKIIDMYFRTGLGRSELEKGLHAILFWGGVSLVFGVTGQATGIYNALRVISRAKEISMQAVSRGLAESYTTTIFGLELFLVAALVWYWLFSRLRKRDAA